MLWHVILGLLRDGRSRHGYELMTEYRARSGNKVSGGNFYRELARLTASGLVETHPDPSAGDPRRIPYRIKDRGREAFDRWLAAPSMDDGDLALWLLFADRASGEVRERILERHEEHLWLRSKALARLRDDAVASQNEDPTTEYDPLPFLLARQMKQLAGELEVLKELRLWFDARQRASERTGGRGQPVAAGGPPARRKRGSSRR